MLNVRGTIANSRRLFFARLAFFSYGDFLASFFTRKVTRLDIFQDATRQLHFPSEEEGLGGVTSPREVRHEVIPCARVRRKGLRFISASLAIDHGASGARVNALYRVKLTVRRVFLAI